MIDETGCESVRFDESTVKVYSDTARTFKKLTLAKAVTEADLIIGLPKLKTHNLTYYTGAVKLLYGYMPGMFKSEHHLHTAHDLNLFAELLFDLHEMCPPSITIMDAIVGMEVRGLLMALRVKSGSSWRVLAAPHSTILPLLSPATTR